MQVSEHVDGSEGCDDQSVRPKQDFPQTGPFWPVGLGEDVSSRQGERLIDGLAILPFLCDVYDPPPRMAVHKESLTVLVRVQTLLDHDPPWLEQMMGHIQ